VYGEALAMLVGDALQALAFDALAQLSERGVPAAAALAAVGELARAAGSRGMAGGQAIDLWAVGRTLDAAALERMHRMKTGAMLAASVRIGALCGEPLATAHRAALETYGAAVGLAFQVVDDVLDVESDTQTLGKTAGKDSEQNKPTYVTVLGLAQARQLATRLREQAHDALQPLGERGQRLRELADLIVMRKS
ncbi:MAG TPA: polyprenyl synthetase family protein, partial [Burkholderiaceae bacterium]|nr:polyprenyl synthetase family protein [Burkholderiaceae bacterium]